MSESSSPLLLFGVGVFYIGIVVGSILFGITILQVYIYCNRGFADGLLLKLSVAALCFLDGLHLVFVVHVGYRYLIVDVNDPGVLEKSFWSLRATPIARILVARLVQCIYLGRIWRMLSKAIGKSRGRYLMIIIVVVAAFLCIAAGAVVIVALATESGASTQFRGWPGWLEFTSSAFLDCCITVLMIVVLRRGLNGGQRMKTLVSALIQYAIASGFVTSVACVTYLVLYERVTNSLAYGAMEAIVSSLYANSLLAMLNARAHLREQLAGGPITVEVSERMQFRRRNSSSLNETPKELPIEDGTEVLATILEAADLP
ncbi:hypothetical protein JAAARDRAFT_32345 [Jaapia argillacea MUCL 33604]|uniref:DUF6534 domain-containing protein n=1 Tax=Jaapia argillacea MUCL 33604 TaxID=933084 RepID=A0A067Q1H4_9AGAM|nr:hypothetical protein JAAARDRAFT_32345 [Jaapia argillacea MUCL 33604]